MVVYHAPATRRLAHAIPVSIALAGLGLWAAAVGAFLIFNVQERRGRVVPDGWVVAAVAAFFLLTPPMIFLVPDRLSRPWGRALLVVLLGSWLTQSVRALRRRYGR